MSDLGDRIKGYEEVFARQLTRRVPVVVRVDGRAFHTFTRGCERPFDRRLMAAMVQAAHEVSCEMQGFCFAYVQSDEASFCLTDYDTVDTQGWFGYDLNKIVSISAALMTAEFNRAFPSERGATFDARAFNVPKDDVINAFLWRAKDWERNSLQMYCRAHFSHKQLHGKGRADMHEMLHGIGKNWATDTTDQERNGTFILPVSVRYDITPSYAALNAALGRLLEPKPAEIAEAA